MLDINIFNDEFVDFIGPHFGVKTESERIVLGYYEAFSGLTDSRFVQVMKAAFTECDRRTFSVPWVLARAVELSNRESLAELPALQSADQRELDMQSEEELSMNRKRLAVMMGSIGRMKSAAVPEVEALVRKVVKEYHHAI